MGDDSAEVMVLGKHWAAMRKDNVVGLISMRVPGDIDFDEYRKKATACLEMLGEVKSGELIEKDGKRYFIQRLNHANRGKTPRDPKVYEVYQPKG